MQEEILQKDKEIKKLKKAIEEGDEKRQELEQVHEINLQKTIHHIKAEMGKANEIKVAHLKAEHQAEIDKMLETSRCKYIRPCSSFARGPHFCEVLLS